jgi:hypothetical protein
MKFKAGNGFNEKHTPAERHTLARLRLCRIKLRHEGKLMLDGYIPPEHSDGSVQRIWRSYGWLPKTESDAKPAVSQYGIQNIVPINNMVYSTIKKRRK